MLNCVIRIWGYYLLQVLSIIIWGHLPSAGTFHFILWAMTLNEMNIVLPLRIRVHFMQQCGVRKWQFLIIYSTVNHQRGGWVGLKKSKTWWRNTWMVPKHCWFLEHWNRQKSLSNIRQRFSCLLDKGIAKICKKKNFHEGFFFKSTLSVLRCTWTGRINLKIFLGYNITYLSIWPFMRHPWFPTRKASKLPETNIFLLSAPIIQHNAGAEKLELKTDKC